MKLQAKEIKKLMPNRVLVRANRASEELKSGIITHKSGLLIDGRFEKEYHTITDGTVIKICERLFYNRIPQDNSLEWDCDNELEIGDTVIFHYLSQLNRFDRGEYFEDDGNIYFIMKYDELFVAERDGKIICINGWNLVEPIDKEQPKTSLIMPDKTKSEKRSETLGIVRHISKPLREYKYITDSLGQHLQDTDEIKAGDTIGFNRAFSILLQNDMYNILDKTYYRIQRKDIFTIKN